MTKTGQYAGKGTKKGTPRGTVDATLTTPMNRKRVGAICGAKRTGKSQSGPGVCCQPAGWGTDHPGIGHCKLHGGNTPNVEKADITKHVMKEAIMTYGAPLDITPEQALLDEVHRTSGHVEWLRQRIATMGQEGKENAALHQFTQMGVVPSFWIQAYQDERRHLVQVCKAAITSGLQERQVRLAEQQGQMIASILQAFLQDQRMSFTQPQLNEAPHVIRELLMTIPRGELPSTRPSVLDVDSKEM